MPARVQASEAAVALLGALQQGHGEVFFYLSHGCCDGSSPLCLAPGELQLSPADLRWGTVAGAGFWLSPSQAVYLGSVQLLLGVEPGSNGGFSLEDGSGLRFVLRQRLFSDDELATLARQDAPAQR